MGMEQFKDKKVTNSNIREFADLKDGYASGRFDYQSQNGVKGGEATTQLQPFSGELDDPKASISNGLVPFDGTLDSDTSKKGPEVPFQSGSAFKDTKDLIPSLDDIKGVWKTFKDQWDNRHNTPMTPEIAHKMMQDEHSAGSAILDTVGAIPAMAVGGARGIYEGIKSGDATTGLKAGSDTMSSLLPSSLMGNKEDQDREGYKAAMAPFTGVMDTLNAIPQGYGEILNAAGAPNAAAQVTDAGKLGIMAAFGAKGAHEIYKAITGKELPEKEAAAKLKALLDDPSQRVEPTLPPEPAVPTSAHADDFAAINPYDVAGHVTELENGSPATIDNAQGDLFGGTSLEQAPRSVGGETISAGETLPSLRNSDGKSNYIGEPIPFDKNAGSMPDNSPGAPINHRDNTLPWQLSPEDRAPTNNTGAPTIPRESISENTPIVEGNKPAEQAAYEKFLQEQHDKKVAEIDAAHLDVARQKRADLGRIEGEVELQFNRNIEAGMPHPEAVKEAQAHEAQLKSDAEAKAKAADDALMQKYVEAKHSTDTMRQALEQAQQVAETKRTAQVAKQALRDRANPAYDELARRKEADYAAMEAQRELDFNASTRRIEEQGIRRAFLDRSNMDFQHMQDVVKDKTLLPKDKNIMMRGFLRQGDIGRALGILASDHPIKSYRDLANYLSDKLDGLKVVMHDEPTIKSGDRSITGYYDPNTHTVGLSGLGATSPHTVLHELTHAVTSHFINTRPNDVRVTGLKSLYKMLSNDAGIKNFPGIVNVKEFVAEAFSNPKFQEFLKGEHMNNKTVWQRFVDGVKSIFGIRTGIETPLSNAFEHTMDLGKQIIEASNGMATPLEQFKKANMPSKLADLMAQKPKDTVPEVVTNGNVQDVVRKMTGMEKLQAQFDFTPKPPEEVAQMAKAANDIPAGNLETLKANLDSGGLMASLRHNNNPIIKYTFAYVDHAVKLYEKSVRDNITNKDTGIKSLLQKLSKDEYTILHSQMMLDEGHVVRTPQELAALGHSEKMIAAYSKMRTVSTEILKKANEVRASMNPPLEPMTERIGHLAGRFMGDFSHMVFDAENNAVMRVTGNTKWGAQKIADFIAKEHPEWSVGKQEYNDIKTSSSGDRFLGFRELMNYVGKNDPVVAKALDTLDKYNRNAAVRYLDATRHAKDKKEQAGGIIGSEGNKAWLDAHTNAEQGFKGQLAYLDTTYKWLEMQKAMENISKVTTDPDVIKQQPNAIKWSTAYTDHALHRNQGFLADFANSLLSEVGRVTGIGHTTLKRGVNWTSAAEMRNWMGIGNIPFALKHMLLPFQKMPAMMAYVKTIGDAEGSLVVNGARSLESYYKYLRNDTDLTPFQKEAFKFAKENNVFNVDLSDTSGKIQSSKLGRAIGKFSDLDFSAPEHAIRGTSFFFYAHLLEKSGMPVQAALSSAEHMSKFLYTDYAQHEAPRGAAKGGWIGQLALQITRYKANEIGQLGFFNRERISMSDQDHTAMQKVMSNTPLMVHMGSLLAFTGATGMLAFNEMDKIYSLWTKYIHGNPDNLTALLHRSNAPDLIKYGLFAKLGIDSKISEAQLLPAPFPTTVAEISQLGMAFDAARYHDVFHAKKLALSLTPSTLRGYAENHMFTQPPETSGPNAGKSLYLNPNTGEGRVYRDDKTQNIRNIGFHTTAETNELQDNYSKKRIMQDHADLADHIMEKAKGLLASGTSPQEVATRLGPQYMQHVQAHQPDFTTALTSYMEKQREDQKTQMILQQQRDKLGNSLKIVTGR